jgi:hypothetical protein
VCILGDRDRSDQIREWQRDRALNENHGRFKLPSRDRCVLYRVRSMGVSVVSKTGSATLTFPAGAVPLEPDDSDVASWIVAHDYVDECELDRRFRTRGREALTSLIGRLQACSVLDRISES